MILIATVGTSERSVRAVMIMKEPKAFCLKADLTFFWVLVVNLSLHWLSCSGARESNVWGAKEYLNCKPTEDLAIFAA